MHGNIGFTTELDDIHDIQAGCIRLQVYCFLQTVHGASVSGGVKDPTKLLESPFGKQERR